MFKAYSDIFKAKGSFSFSISAVLARFPVAMMTLSILIMLSHELNSYTVPGIIAGIYALMNAIMMPLTARLADRFGQNKIGYLTSTVAIIAGLCLFATVYLRGPVIFLAIFAAITATMPSFGAFVRARWSQIYHGQSQLNTAFAFESIMDEITYIIGPALAVYLATRFFAGAGLIAALGFLLIGSFWFCSQRKTQPQPRPLHKTTKDASLIRQRPMQLLLIVIIAIGTVVGATEVVAVAFADTSKIPQAASWAIAAYAIGSLISGLIFGAIRWKVPLNQLLIILTFAVFILTLPPLFVTNIWQFTIALFFAGFACAPLMICCFSLIEKIVPSHQLTEGISYEAAGLGIGIAIGSALAGKTVDLYGAQYGFTIALIATALAFIPLFFYSSILLKPIATKPS